MVDIVNSVAHGVNNCKDTELTVESCGECVTSSHSQIGGFTLGALAALGGNRVGGGAATVVVSAGLVAALFLAFWPRIPKLAERVRSESSSWPALLRVWVWWTVGCVPLLWVWVFGAATTLVALAVLAIIA